MDKSDSFEQGHKSSASTSGGEYRDHPSAQFSRRDSCLPSFGTYKHGNLVVHVKMHVLIKMVPLFFNSIMLFSNKDIRCIVSLYSLMADVSRIILYQNR
jgi:hypothetical protein